MSGLNGGGLGGHSRDFVALRCDLYRLGYASELVIVVMVEQKCAATCILDEDGIRAVLFRLSYHSNTCVWIINILPEDIQQIVQFGADRL